MKNSAYQPNMVSYPNIALWLHKGFVEISQGAGNRVIARASDNEGVVWEGSHYQNTDEAMQALDSAIAHLTHLNEK
jgi:hypothetical protein